MHTRPFLLFLGDLRLNNYILLGTRQQLYKLGSWVPFLWIPYLCLLHLYPIPAHGGPLAARTARMYICTMKTDRPICVWTSMHSRMWSNAFRCCTIHRQRNRSVLSGKIVSGQKDCMVKRTRRHTQSSSGGNREDGVSMERIRLCHWRHWSIKQTLWGSHLSWLIYGDQQQGNRCHAHPIPCVDLTWLNELKCDSLLRKGYTLLCNFLYFLKFINSSNRNRKLEISKPMLDRYTRNSSISDLVWLLQTAGQNNDCIDRYSAIVGQ